MHGVYCMCDWAWENWPDLKNHVIVTFTYYSYSYSLLAQTKVANQTQSCKTAHWPLLRLYSSVVWDPVATSLYLVISPSRSTIGTVYPTTPPSPLLLPTCPLYGQFMIFCWKAANTASWLDSQLAIRPNKVKNMFLVLLPGQFFLSHFLFFSQVCYHFYQYSTQFIIENCVATAVLPLLC